jgi:hypothetical protein
MATKLQDVTGAHQPKPKKLKKARGALLRAINSGRTPPPPGYAGPDDEMPTEAEAEESYQETLFDQACLLLDSMAAATRQRFFAYLKERYQLAKMP